MLDVELGLFDLRLEHLGLRLWVYTSGPRYSTPIFGAPQKGTLQFCEILIEREDAAVELVKYV